MAQASAVSAEKPGPTCTYGRVCSLSRNVGTLAQTRGDLRERLDVARHAIFGDRQTFPLRGYIPKRGICGRTRADLHVSRWQSGGTAFDVRSLKPGATCTNSPIRLDPRMLALPSEHGVTCDDAIRTRCGPRDSSGVVRACSPGPVDTAPPGTPANLQVRPPMPTAPTERQRRQVDVPAGQSTIDTKSHIARQNYIRIGDLG